MRVGIHLPQYGRAASPDAIRRAAVHAEELGFADLWVSDHVVMPADQGYPSPYLYDPLVTLT
jgi:alkanesulfonate monooxygenase SsuD/methylene tetrahydromethanopterin reductase-like flavin-dependent oxidoreductase (luciferase family)